MFRYFLTFIWCHYCHLCTSFIATTKLPKSNLCLYISIYVFSNNFQVLGYMQDKPNVYINSIRYFFKNPNINFIRFYS